MKPVRAILIGAGSRGYRSYASYALTHPQEIRFVAVAEPDDGRRNAFCNTHKIAPKYAFSDYGELFEAGIEADVVFICTQDQQHYRPAMMALYAGYHLVLEKPMSNRLEESREIVRTAREKNREVIVCHVLRYTAFFGRIKELIDGGEIGKLCSLTLSENVGYYHAAHSYVRGNWRSEEQASPMLLAKSCHDIDLLCWLVGTEPCKVASFGGLHFFNAENAPEGSAKYCLGGCKAKDTCPYDAEKVYMDPAVTGWPVNVVTEDLSQEGRREALRTGPYGRCVFACDNDVVDRQVVVLEYGDGVTANFSMNALSAQMCRVISVHGSYGQIWGCMEDEKIYLQKYGQPIQCMEVHPVQGGEYGHGGGDEGFMRAVCRKFANLESGHIAGSCDALISHIICDLAEKSRKNGTVMCYSGPQDE